jgi:hypothetical protein
MDASVALLAFGSFVGGLLVVARVVSWVVGLIVYFKPSTPAATSPRPAFAIAQVFLHSGPWVLAVAVVAVYYAATSARAAYLWAVLGGLGLAAAFVGLETVRALWRRRSAQPEPPLTPERFASLRGSFFRRNSVLFAIAMPVGSALMSSFDYERELGLLFFLCLAGALTGWVWSWFMWQWYGEALKVREKARQKRERQSAV